ncbi:MAG: CDGSH iron-sulfur domain-containing protein [Planctomycetes bacterium]|nr:CDGSH iron-sulfur domain-containing protein [Planctomycetota bacterium]
MDEKDWKITITRDGPYEVTGEPPLHCETIVPDAMGNSVAWQKGKEYHRDSTGAPTRLCRCGHSRDKPYCDGTHEDVGFIGYEHADRPPYREHARRQRGEGIDLLDDESLCTGARFCDVGATVWGYVAKSGDPESRRRAVEEACKCPSGRLTITTPDGGMVEPKIPKEIGLVEDPVNNCRGPLWIRGGIPIRGANGEAYETRNRTTLCRCGESRNQPYCDGSHYHCAHMRGLDG